MIKIVLILTGIILCSLGLFFIIIYANLLTIGYSLKDFVYFIIRRPYFYFIIVGIIFIYYGLERNKIHELLLRFKLRFFKR